MRIDYTIQYIKALKALSRNAAEIKAYHKVLGLLDQLTPDTTADEMREWMEERQEVAIIEGNRLGAPYQYSRGAWDGRRNLAQEFGERFKKSEGLPDPWTCYLRFAKEMSHGKAEHP